MHDYNSREPLRTNVTAAVQIGWVTWRLLLWKHTQSLFSLWILPVSARSLPATVRGRVGRLEHKPQVASLAPMMAGKNGDVFGATAEEGPTGIINKIFPKMITQASAKDWFDRRRAHIRPWSNFVDQRRFSRPVNFGDVCKRVTRNVEHFQSNYIFIFMGLILYCIITSPMLLIALAVFFGACYIIYLKTLQSKMIMFGRELTMANQYGIAGAVSFPFFWLAGAGAAVFWVLGATLVVIGSHAAFHEVEGDVEELQMEPV